MEESGLELPLLAGHASEEFDSSKEDNSDYILIFHNPFASKDMNEKKGLSATTIGFTEGAESFLAMFRTSINQEQEEAEKEEAENEEAENEEEKKKKRAMAGWRKKLKNMIDEFITKLGDYDEIPFDKFAKLCIGAVVDILQTELKLKVELFTGVDSSTIFCKIRAKEENLKIHAELIEYHM